jgi:hypothetical protein
LGFARGGAHAADRAVTDAVLHNLAEDPAEQEDLSDANAETKQRLFAEYQAFVAARKLKPLAVQFEAKKDEKKGQKRPSSPEPKARTKGPRAPQDPPSSESGPDRTEIRTKDYAATMAELRKKLAGVLTDEQKQARDAAWETPPTAYAVDVYDGWPATVFPVSFMAY